ncbi:MAG: hypothetical protein J1F29_01040 [Lentimicrobiaceae bacterium]|nr:hypothetical protein [Lentimicrobiaceae bacterium]
MESDNMAGEFKQCSNGHYYQGETCPYCNENEKSSNHINGVNCDVLRVYDISYDCIFNKEYSFDETIAYLFENKMISSIEDARLIVEKLTQYAKAKTGIYRDVILGLILGICNIFRHSRMINKTFDMTDLWIFTGIIIFIICRILYRQRKINKKIKDFRKYLASH